MSGIPDVPFEPGHRDAVPVGGEGEVVEEAVVDLGGGVAVRCVDDGGPLRAGERDDARRPQLARVAGEGPYAGTRGFGLHDLAVADVDEGVLVLAEPGAVEAFTPCDEPAGGAACGDDREIAGLRAGHHCRVTFSHARMKGAPMRTQLRTGASPMGHGLTSNARMISCCRASCTACASGV